MMWALPSVVRNLFSQKFDENKYEIMKWIIFSWLFFSKCRGIFHWHDFHFSRDDGSWRVQEWRRIHYLVLFEAGRVQTFDVLFQFEYVNLSDSLSSIGDSDNRSPNSDIDRVDPNLLVSAYFGDVLAGHINWSGGNETLKFYIYSIFGVSNHIFD